MDDLSDEDRVKALQELHELLSNQVLLPSPLSSGVGCRLFFADALACTAAMSSGNEVRCRDA